MRKVITTCVVLAAAASLSGCFATTANNITAAGLADISSAYDGAKANVRAANSARFIMWKDMACTIPMGALRDNASEYKAAVKAVFSICKVSSGSDSATIDDITSSDDDDTTSDSTSAE